VYKDRLGNLWATNPAGRSRLWKDGHSTAVSGFSTPFSYRMLEDRDGTLWIGTAKEGLYRADAAMRESARHAGACGYVLKDNLLEGRNLLRAFSARD
jgi:ligand-binding sensor domain-containing protein